ncbi:hypothetical protein KEM55_008618, partial [Ascosphaera atra]
HCRSRPLLLLPHLWQRSLLGPPLTGPSPFPKPSTPLPPCTTSKLTSLPKRLATDTSLTNQEKSSTWSVKRATSGLLGTKTIPVAGSVGSGTSTLQKSRVGCHLPRLGRS